MKNSAAWAGWFTMDKWPSCAVIASLFAIGSYSQAQVVSEDACPKHAVDIAAYATCDGDKIASSRPFDLQSSLIPEAHVPQHKQTSLGLYVDAVNAHRLKTSHPGRVVLVDVRSQLETVIAGRTRAADIHVPYLEHTLYRNGSERGWTIAENAGFLDEVMQRLQQHNAEPDTVIMVLSRSGERSAKVIDHLAGHGYLLAVNVIDGFEGDLGADGRRSVNGWKNAGLPWSQDTHAIAGYVDVTPSN